MEFSGEQKPTSREVEKTGARVSTYSHILSPQKKNIFMVSIELFKFLL